VTEQGELIAERYRLVALIGRGAMGVVWRAQDERLDRVVAVKQLLLVGEMEALARREGQVGARVRHPHAVMVHDSVEHDGQPWLVMEYFQGSSMASLVVAQGVLPHDRVAAIGGQIASALAAAHAEGVVHRDVKPANVLVAAEGTAKIADFGIARTLGDEAVTGGDVVVGTPAYLAPEVASGEQASFSSDVFSLGATLLAALEGEPPFGLDHDPIALLHRVAAGAMTPPRQAGPVVNVVLWMLQSNPDQRPTMREVHEALTAIADGHPPPMPVPNSTLALPAPRRRKRWPVRIVAAALMLAVGVVIGTLLASRPPEPGTANPPPAQPPTPPAAADASCQARYAVTDSWSSGYQAIITVVNNDRADLTGWTVSWALPAGHSINNLWNGAFVQDGSTITVRNATWNATVAGNDSTTFGLVANAPTTGDPARPTLTCQSR
jgi:serine/threonine protein kinase